MCLVTNLGGYDFFSPGLLTDHQINSFSFIIWTPKNANPVIGKLINIMTDFRAYVRKQDSECDGNLKSQLIIHRFNEKKKTKTNENVILGKLSGKPMCSQSPTIYYFLHILINELFLVWE